jgi:hypothetical protein
MQSSQVLRALPVVACLAFPSARLVAQVRYRVIADGAWFCQQAEGKRLTQIDQGVDLVGGDAAPNGDWQEVTLEGWIFQSSVGPSARPDFDLAVIRAPEENLRAKPSGDVITKLPQGFGLAKVGEDGKWVHVRRSGWMERTSLAPVTPGGPPGASDTSDTATRLQPARRTMVYRAPDGPVAGTISQATPLRVLSKSGEWARVEMQGWVKASDLESAPAGVLVGVSAAEVRADPQRFVGQTLRWTLQFLSQAQADELRPEMPPGATYLLARGPLPERGFVYVVVPDSKKALVEKLVPLSVIAVTATVRAGRSRYLGNPVVDLVTLEVGPTP